MIVAEPQGSRHFAAPARRPGGIAASPRRTGGDSTAGGRRAPDDESEPEPDLAVVPGTFRDYRLGSPDPARHSWSRSARPAWPSIAPTRAASMPGPSLVDYSIVNLPGASTRGLSRPRARRDLPVRLAIQLDLRSGAGPAAGRLRVAAGSTRSAHPDLRSLLGPCALVGEKVREVNQVLVGDQGSAPAAVPHW